MAVLLLAALVSGAAASTSILAANDETTLRVEHAIADAIRGRLGEGAEVSVSLGQVRLTDGELDDGTLQARPAPGARLARPTRFTLYYQGSESADPPVRVGYAVAETHVAIEHVRTARPIDRGTVLTDDDLMTIDGDVGAVPMKALPTHVELVGTLAGRDLRSGDLVTNAVITFPKLVRARDSVVVSVQVGAVRVSGRATAMESGELGQVISLMNEQSGRRLYGRVTSLGEVEVVQ